MLGKGMWYLCKRENFSWIWSGFHKKSCHVLLSRWELPFCPLCPSGMAHRVPELCVPGCPVVFEPCKEVGPKECARDRIRHKPCQNTRHSPVSNLLGVRVSQVLWSSNVGVTKGRQDAWLVGFGTKGTLERELPALACSLPEDRKLFSILLTPSLPKDPKRVKASWAAGERSYCPAPWHLFEPQLGCANQWKAILGQNSDPAAFVKTKVSLAWPCI